MFLRVVFYVLLPLAFAVPIAFDPCSNTVTHMVDGIPLACTTGGIGIDPSIPISYIAQFCSTTSASKPDWLIKVTGLPQGNVNILYAWEAAGDDYSQTCSTKCVQAFNDIIHDCKWPCEDAESIPHTDCCGKANMLAMRLMGRVPTLKLAENLFLKSPQELKSVSIMMENAGF
jgi:hypothetical protein